MTHRTHIRFVLNGREVTVPDVGASQTLLDFLRLDRRMTGTKEGCAGRTAGGRRSELCAGQCLHPVSGVGGWLSCGDH